MALLCAARKPGKVAGVLSICAPIELVSYGARFVPTLVSMNTLLHRVALGTVSEYVYVENVPENPHINYTRNPLHGVRELSQAIYQCERELPQMTAPLLVLQGSHDDTVHPNSAQRIFSAAGAQHKQLVMLERRRHGIVNHEGREDVFMHVRMFLEWAASKETAKAAPAIEDGAAQPSEDMAALAQQDPAAHSA